MRVKVPKDQVGDDNDETEEQTREITQEQEDSMRSVIMNVYACQGSTMSKKIALSTSTDPESVMSSLLGN